MSDENMKDRNMENKPDARNKAGGTVRCPYCSKDNEKGRQFCWACYSPLADTVTQNEHGVIVRKSYLFVPDESITSKAKADTTEPKKAEVPIDYSSSADHASDRIRTRTGEEVIKFPHRDIQIFKGSHLIAVRIDGKNYTSEDMDVPPEARSIINRVAQGQSVQSIMDELKDKSSPGSVSTSAYVQRNSRGKSGLFGQSYSTLFIVGLLIVILFQMLFVLKDCG